MKCDCMTGIALKDHHLRSSKKKVENIKTSYFKRGEDGPQNMAPYGKGRVALIVCDVISKIWKETNRYYLKVE